MIAFRSATASFFLACSIAGSTIAQTLPAPDLNSNSQVQVDRLRELENENTRLQQELIQLRNTSLKLQLSVRLRDEVIERYAQQTDAMTTAQLNLIDQHKKLIGAAKLLQFNPGEARRNAQVGEVLTAVGLGMATSNAPNVAGGLTDALTAYSNSLNSTSTSYLREIRALNTQREDRQSQQRMEVLLNDLSNSLNRIQFNNGYWWRKR